MSRLLRHSAAILVWYGIVWENFPYSARGFFAILAMSELV
jgi:hypothetical protein